MIQLRSSIPNSSLDFHERNREFFRDLIGRGSTEVEYTQLCLVNEVENFSGDLIDHGSIKIEFTPPVIRLY